MTLLRNIISTIFIFGLFIFSHNVLAAYEFGQSVALSGNMEVGGKGYATGFLTAIVDLNLDGGINSQILNVTTLDDGYEPAAAAANAEYFIENNMLGIFATVGTPTSFAIMPYCIESNIPLFAPLTGANSLRSPFHRNVVHYRVSYSDEIISAVSNERGQRRIGVVYQNDAFGVDGYNSLHTYLRMRGIVLKAKATYERQATDLASTVATLYQDLRKHSSGELHLVYFIGVSAALVDLLIRLPAGVTVVCISFAFPDANGLFGFDTATALKLQFTSATPLPSKKAVPGTLEDLYIKARARVSGSALSVHNGFDLAGTDVTLWGLEGYTAGLLLRQVLEYLAYSGLPINSTTIVDGVYDRGLFRLASDLLVGPFLDECDSYYKSMTQLDIRNIGCNNVCGCNRGSHKVYLIGARENSTGGLEVYKIRDKTVFGCEAFSAEGTNPPIVVGYLPPSGLSLNSLHLDPVYSGILALFEYFNEQDGIHSRNLHLSSYAQTEGSKNAILHEITEDDDVMLLLSPGPTKEEYFEIETAVLEDCVFNVSCRSHFSSNGTAIAPLLGTQSSSTAIYTGSRATAGFIRPSFVTQVRGALHMIAKSTFSQLPDEEDPEIVKTIETSGLHVVLLCEESECVNIINHIPLGINLEKDKNGNTITTVESLSTSSSGNIVVFKMPSELSLFSVSNEVLTAMTEREMQSTRFIVQCPKETFGVPLQLLAAIDSVKSIAGSEILLLNTDTTILYTFLSENVDITHTLLDRSALYALQFLPDLYRVPAESSLLKLYFEYIQRIAPILDHFPENVTYIDQNDGSEIAHVAVNILLNNSIVTSSGFEAFVNAYIGLVGMQGTPIHLFSPEKIQSTILGGAEIIVEDYVFGPFGTNCTEGTVKLWLDRIVAANSTSSAAVNTTSLNPFFRITSYRTNATWAYESCYIPPAEKTAPADLTGIYIGVGSGLGVLLASVAGFVRFKAWLDYQRLLRSTMIPYEELTVNEWIGEGGTAFVKKGEYQGTAVAIKYMKKTVKSSNRKRRNSVTGSTMGTAVTSVRYSAPTTTIVSGQIPDYQQEHDGSDLLTSNDTREFSARLQETVEGLANTPSVTSPGCNQLRGSVVSSDRGSSIMTPTFQGSTLDATSAMDTKGMEKKIGMYSSYKQYLEHCMFLYGLRNPNVLMFLGGSKDPETGLYCQVFELMEGGHLKGLLQNPTADLEWVDKIRYAVDTARGILYLHNQHPSIIHGDIKSANVLLNRYDAACIADISGPMLKFACTPEYAAPEVLAEKAFTCASDVYSFGVMMWELMTRETPFAEIDRKTVIEGVKMGTLKPLMTPPEFYDPDMPPKYPSLIQECLLESVSRRPGIEEVLKRLEAMQEECKELTTQLAAENQKKPTSLLYEIFPPKVAEALINNQPVEPEQFECVTILFSDICGFTTLSSVMKAEEVLAMLDRLYQTYDKLNQENGMFKVETIGDAYMSTAGLHPRCEPHDHAVKAVNMALDMIQNTATFPVSLENPKLGCLRIRVGLHSGAVVASVAGTINRRYCLFGDTVNVSSRMESNSLPLKVHISNVTRKFLLENGGADDYVLEPRGFIEIKGKGNMKTFFVRRKADPLIEAMTRAMLAADEVAKDIQNANEGLKLNLTGISTDGSLSFGSLSQASEPRLSARLSARARHRKVNLPNMVVSTAKIGSIDETTMHNVSTGSLTPEPSAELL